MKKIYLVGFLGVGIRDPRYEQEHPLIQVGHVGIAFEDNPGQILGFHPTQAAIESVGGTQNALNLLRNRQTLEGALQDDSLIFERAYVLSQNNSKITVWQITLNVADPEFERVQTQTFAWYNQGRTFAYAFPRKDAMPADRDNCATFPRKLNLPVFEPTGHLYFYLPIFEKQGEKWQPKG